MLLKYALDPFVGIRERIDVTSCSRNSKKPLEQVSFNINESAYRLAQYTEMNTDSYSNVLRFCLRRFR